MTKIIREGGMMPDDEREEELLDRVVDIIDEHRQFLGKKDWNMLRTKIKEIADRCRERARKAQ